MSTRLELLRHKLETDSQKDGTLLWLIVISLGNIPMYCVMDDK